jgi:formylglycine-generating enzyme required for sulfatase activity
MALTLALASPAAAYHSADTTGNWKISLTELLRGIQFYNAGGLHCQAGTEDGHAPGPGLSSCASHDSDYAPQDWRITLTELLRLIQFFNAGAYSVCADTEDGYAVEGQTSLLMLPGNVTLETVWCPSGSFAMGSLETEQDCDSDEWPQHPVTVGTGFWTSKYEITKAQ